MEVHNGSVILSEHEAELTGLPERFAVQDALGNAFGLRDRLENMRDAACELGQGPTNGDRGHYDRLVGKIEVVRGIAHELAAHVAAVPTEARAARNELLNELQAYLEDRHDTE